MSLPTRIEQAEGPSRELDAEIAAAVRYFPKGVGFVWQADLKANSPEVGRVECCTSLGTGGPHYEAPRYTSSIDAALTLVGDDCWRVEDHPLAGPCAVVGDCEGYARTPAMALCAAALRAKETER